MIDYISLLKQNNLKATIQRTNILKSINRTGHITIDEIYEELKIDYPTLSLATIYKNILLMVQHGVIVEIPISGEKSKYEIKKDEHIHLICKSCGNIEDRELSSCNIDIEDFNIIFKQINLYGLCRNCQSK